ncbi:MAG: hypothetical protein WC552_09545 [Candidatus Omnitrophota bacterium]
MAKSERENNVMLKAGLVFIGIMVVIFFANKHITDDISGMSQPPAVSPAVVSPQVSEVIEKKGQAGPAEVANYSTEAASAAAKVTQAQESREETPADKEIIRELPLQDVVLMQ